ncbi:MAG: VWA domain-containing protein [Xanthobacteraceae bacterium]
MMFRNAIKFLKDRRGNIGPIFAISLIPTVGAIGSAVDYTRANDAKAALQAALDSTTLAMASKAAALTADDLNIQATNYFNAVFNKTETTGVTLNIKYSNDAGPKLVIAGATSVKTQFLNLPGFNITYLPVAASSTTAWGNSRLRVSLVLDNTGSMADFNKIGALKTATKNLLGQLKAAATNNGDVYVSIVPFVKDVNLGASNYVASWIDWTAWDGANGTCSSSRYTSESSCQSHGKTWTPHNHNTWNGCVVDRGNSGGPSSSNYDTNVVAPSMGNSASQYSAEQYASCPQPVMGLNDDWSAMNTLVNNMAAAGNTNQAIGLQVGWLSLAGGGPFNVPAYDPNYTYQKVIILLTDGLNTQDRWYTDETSIDNWQKLTCDNVKAAGITLYTIQVNTGGDPTSTLLKNCASDASKFFLLTSASQIVTTFDQIGTKLSQLHLAK